MDQESLKLFKVNLAGLHGIGNSEIDYGNSYVVAKNPNDAYIQVKAFLDKNDLGFDYERELCGVSLMADSKRYNTVGRLLFLPTNTDDLVWESR